MVPVSWLSHAQEIVPHMFRQAQNLAPLQPTLPVGVPRAFTSACLVSVHRSTPSSASESLNDMYVQHAAVIAHL